MLPGLRSEPEERKEDKGAERCRPTVELNANGGPAVHIPYDGGNESDTTKVVVSIAPTDPWIEWLETRVEDYLEDGERDGAQ